MTSAIKILIVLTSHGVFGDANHRTGLWMEELTTPYYVFTDAGAAVDIVSIAGGKVPVDPKSLEPAGKNPASVERFLADPQAMAKIENSQALSAVEADGYDAVFMPGGHGTMFDLPNSAALAKLLGDAWQQSEVIAAVCHGPAGLVSAKDAAGRAIVAGRTVSAFTNSEEAAAGLTRAVPFLLEARIRELGANYRSGPDFQPFAVRDGNLVTGQNPQSSEKVAELVLEAVGDRADQ